MIIIKTIVFNPSDTPHLLGTLATPRPADPQKHPTTHVQYSSDVAFALKASLVQK